MKYQKDLIDHLGGWVDVDLVTKVYCTPQEPDDYALFYEGNIRFTPQIEDGDKDERNIGKITFWLFDPYRAAEADVPMCDLLDAPSAETAELLELFPNDDWSPQVVAALGGSPPSAGILFLERMDIGEQWRGRGIGLVVADTIIRAYSADCGIVALKPFPVQFSGKGDDPNYRPALQKLKRYWSRLKTKRVKGSDLLIIDPDLTRPTIDEILARRKPTR